MALDRCARRQHPIMLTQSSGKVYVGYVITTSFQETDWIRILPVYSGYRDDQHHFIIETDYSWILDLPSERGRYEDEDSPLKEDFSVLVKLDTLTSAHPFDLRTHNTNSFAYAESPLDFAAQKVSASTTPFEVKNPSGATFFIPDWAPRPMQWDPPFIANPEDERQRVLFEKLYPKGKPITFSTFYLSPRFQHFFYFLYVVVVMVIPAFAAVRDWISSLFCMSAIVVCYLTTSWYNPRL